MSDAAGPQRPRRHCMVVHAYYPVGETRVQREASALVDRGYEVDVLCLRGANEPTRDVHEGVSVYRLPVRRHRGRGFAIQLLEYLAFFVVAGGALTALHLRRRYDVVQVHNLPDFLVFAALAPKIAGTPILLDLHDLMPEFLAARADVPMTSPLVRIIGWQERLACRFADHVLTVTEGWRDTLIRRGVPAAKVTVVMNVADTRVFRRPTDDRITTRSGFHVLYHGTLTRRYGVDLIIDAVALARSDVAGLRLTLLGDGDAREELLAHRARLGLDDLVTISAGMVDASELPAAIQGADAGVVPTRSNVFTDGLLPTKLMEYVAMGTPVIAARTPTVVSYFDDDMVQFFEPGDAADLAAAIRALASDAGRRDALVQNADAFHRKYDWESVAASYAGLVDAVIGGQAVPTAARGPAPVRRATRLSHPAAMQRSRSGNSIRTSSDAHDPEWDDFLAGLPGGHHTQTALWSQVKASLGWRVVRVVADRNSRITGGAQILYRRIPMVGAVGYVSRGPVVAADDSELSARILDAVERIAGELHIRHLTVQPSGVGESTPSYLVGRGYLASSTEVAPRATVVVDVTPEADQILAAMTSRTRYNVRLSERKSVIVREGDSDDLDTFHRLLQATAQRQGFTVQPKSYFESMWHVLAPHGHVRLALAEHDGEAISAQIAIAFGDTVVNKLSVWSGRAGNRRPNEALQWSTILWAHQRGYRCYDLEGLKLKAAQAVVRGEPLPTTATQSVTSFKIGFGGTVVVMPSAHVCIPNRAVRWAFSEVYPRVSGLGSVKAIVKGMRTGSARSGD